MNSASIRNFVIIAHVDHGKSTLADRLLELTGTVEPRKMREQFLDQMDLEREKGITIKMQPVRMAYHSNRSYQLPATGSQHADGGELTAGGQSGSEFILNLIDTPGHADFAYEVSRALAAVEGAILLVDATQGVQAQTVAVLELARREGLVIVPAVNKIDYPSAGVAETARELADLVGCRPEDALRVSGKTGAGVPELLAMIVELVPAPVSAVDVTVPRALVFDSHFDAYRGIIAHVRVVDGSFHRGERIAFLATRQQAEIGELGLFRPELVAARELANGEIGYLATGLKDPDAVRVGDTITTLKSEIPACAEASAGRRNQKSEVLEVEPLPGYREPQPAVWASVYPQDGDEYPKLLDALKKIRLNDAALRFEPEASHALGRTASSKPGRASSVGRGFDLGCLGTLHLEIIGERLAREYGLTPLFTAPSVSYTLCRRGGSEERIYTPSRLPDQADIAEIREPWARVEVIVPQKFYGATMDFLSRTRGSFVEQRPIGLDRIRVTWETPLADIVVDFSDGLKRVTAGYGSFSYEVVGERPGDLVRLDVLVAGERAEALSRIVPRGEAYRAGRAIVATLKELLPRQLFPVAIQAAAGGRIMARETLPALAKNVTGYLYGGDRTRKMKLWQKQKRGKERLKRSGRVLIPPEVFAALLRR